MSRLQRSAVSFRRQGSSGRIWDDPLRSLDLKGPSTTAAPLAEASLAGDRSPRAASSSSFRRGAAAAAAADIPESPETTQSRQSPSRDGTPQERRARRRRRISSAFCACMGHPPASHAQQ